MKVEVQDRPGLSDPWNAARTRAVYTYYGMHQRATAIADADMDLDAEADRAEHFYYDAGWRLLERRRDTFTNTPFATVPAFTLDKADQFVWGQRYIDELMYHRTAEGAGVYALTDRNFSVIAMTPEASASASTPRHRTRYTAYGEARTTLNADINASGVVDSTDQGIVLGAFGGTIATGYPVEADLNNDGVIDSSDFGILLGGFGQSVPPGDVSTTDTPVGYAGYIFDDATGLYCVRFRWYAPEMGRWLSRDPAGYVDGGNLGEYVRSSPIANIDPKGLCSSKSDCNGQPFDPKTQCCEGRKTTRYEWITDPEDQREGDIVIDDGAGPVRIRKHQAGGVVKDKVPIWECQAPIALFGPNRNIGNVVFESVCHAWDKRAGFGLDFIGLGINHSMICLDGPGQNCLAVDASGAIIKLNVSRDLLIWARSAKCKKVMVCPFQKDRIKKSENTPYPYDPIFNNCHRWKPHHPHQSPEP